MRWRALTGAVVLTTGVAGTALTGAAASPTPARTAAPGAPRAQPLADREMFLGRQAASRSREPAPTTITAPAAATAAPPPTTGLPRPNEAASSPREKTREAAAKLRETMRPTTVPPSRPGSCHRGPLSGMAELHACWGGLLATCSWSVPYMEKVMWRESKGWPSAKNRRSSATGLLQILASYHPYDNLYDAETNIRVGCAMFHERGYQPWQL